MTYRTYHPVAVALAAFAAGCSADVAMHDDDATGAYPTRSMGMHAARPTSAVSGAQAASPAMHGMGPAAAAANMPSSMSPSVTPVTMPVTDGPFDGAAAVDTDPSPAVVDVQLEAKPADIELSAGHVVHMWTYNGVFPGPRIEANVGDRVRVTLKNSLPDSTTIHWHGLRVPSAMDGVEAVKKPIAPGDEFTYDFVVPDAGTFWYHPHMRSNEQVERGLYGSIVVRGADEPTTTSDHVVVLDDILLDSSWQIAPFATNPMEAMMGREGNVLLVNGKAHPTLEVTPGGLERFRFINTANARYFRIALPGKKLIQIGSEAGMLSEPLMRDDLLLVPGQRADILVITPDDGKTMTLETTPYQRGHHSDSGGTAPLFELHPAGAKIETPSIPTALGSIDALPAASVTRALRFQESMMMMGGGGMHHGGTTMGSSGGMGPLFAFNGEVFPNVTPLNAKLGDVEDWSLVNTTMMDHPFHLHGFRFQVLSDIGEPLAWRDTLNVPANQTIKIRMRLDDHAGMWMFHCHILEHAERGMMGELNVAP